MIHNHVSAQPLKNANLDKVLNLVEVVWIGNIKQSTQAVRITRWLFLFELESDWRWFLDHMHNSNSNAPSEAFYFLGFLKSNTTVGEFW